MEKSTLTILGSPQAYDTKIKKIDLKMKKMERKVNEMKKKHATTERL